MHFRVAMCQIHVVLYMFCLITFSFFLQFFYNHFSRELRNSPINSAIACTLIHFAKRAVFRSRWGLENFVIFNCHDSGYWWRRVPALKSKHADCVLFSRLPLFYMQFMPFSHRTLVTCTGLHGARCIAHTHSNTLATEWRNSFSMKQWQLNVLRRL